MKTFYYDSTFRLGCILGGFRNNIHLLLSFQLSFSHDRYKIIQYLADWQNVSGTLVPEALCEAKETRGEKEEPLVT
jgi:hypothetical protein